MIKTRVGVTVFFFILAFLILIIRIVAVTLFPDSRLIATIDTTGNERGMIYDRNMKELAVNIDTYSLYARTANLSDQVKNNLYRFLEKFDFLTESDLQKLLTDSSFKWIKRRIDSDDKDILDSIIDELIENGYIEEDDIALTEEQGRFYEYPSTAGMTGFTGVDNQGLMGLEYYFNSYLVEGYNVYTTIDADISRIAFEELKKAVIDNDAEYGSVGIMNVENREILALVNYPTYDPNNLNTVTNTKPYSTSAIYEPGSVMKQFSAAYALAEGYVTEVSPTYVCRKTIEIGDVTFSCMASHGEVNLQDIIRKSCNVGMVQIAENFDNEGYYSFLTNFGFGKKVPLPLTDIEAGILRDDGDWSYLSKYMIAIGQEIGVTTLQLLTACGAIGGGGSYITPKIVYAVSNDQSTNYYYPETVSRGVMSTEMSEKLLSMMKEVVSETGTAIKAKVEGISIAGKTGTGQVADEEAGGYYEDIFNAVFVGYVPANDPKWVIVVSINKPMVEKHTGGEVAAPTFANILRRLIVSTDYFDNYSEEIVTNE